MIEKPKSNVNIAVFVFLVTMTALYLFTLRYWFETRFESRVVSDLTVQKTERARRAERVVLFVFDDTSYDTATRYLTRIIEKGKREGIFCKVILDNFTFTIAGVYTLGTGDQPSLVQIKDEYLSNLVSANHIFENVQLMGGRTVHIGESLWLDMFGDGIDEAFTRRDLGPFVEYGSGEMIQHLEKALENPKNRLIVVHLGETGHVSHRQGVYGDKLAELLRGLDETVMGIAEKNAEDTVWVMASDHGTTLEGQHGGVSEEERTAFMSAFGTGIEKNEIDRISQVDLPNTLAFLLGVPFPSQNTGVLPDVFGRGKDRQIADEELLAQKQRLYNALREKYGDRKRVDTADILSLKSGIERIKFDTGSPLVLGSQIAVLLGVLIFTLLVLGKGVGWVHAVCGLFLLSMVFMVEREQLWLLLLPISIMVSRDARGVKVPSWSGAIFFGLGAIVLLVLFFLFPSKVYLEYRQDVRYAVLFTIIFATLLLFIAASFLNISTQFQGVSRLSLLLWGLAAAYVIATPVRYYQFILPAGLPLLLCVSAYRSSSTVREFWKKILVLLPAIFVLIFLVISQIPDLGLHSFRKVAGAIKENTFFYEMVLAGALLAFGIWLRFKVETRVNVRLLAFGLACVFLLHWGYHSGVLSSNLTLLVAYGFALTVLGIWARKQWDDARDQVLVILILVAMTQQHSPLELALSLGGAVVFCCVHGRNPYAKKDVLGHHAYVAFLLVTYSVYFLTFKGHLFRPSHVQIMKGFLGYNMPVYLPVNTLLVCFYYLEPILLAWFIMRATKRDASPFYISGAIAAALLVFQNIFTASLFSFSILPGDTYHKSAAGSLILLTFGLGFLAAAFYSKWKADCNAGSVTR